MGRPSKKTEPELTKSQNKEIREETVVKTEEVKEEAAVKAEENTKDTQPEIPANVLELMRLYPHYEKFWVTSKGFVHPYGVPKYLIKEATLYKNIYYNK